MGQKLSKREIPEKFLTPRGDLGLDASESRRIRKQVLKGKLAPFYPGVDDSRNSQNDECPICFLQFFLMNRSVCCGQRICSECFVRIKVSSDGSYLGCACPFCKAAGYAVELCEPKSDAEKAEEMLEEQRVLEHRLRQQNQEDQVLRPLNNLTNTSEIISEEEVRVDTAHTAPVGGVDEDLPIVSTDLDSEGRFPIEDEYPREYGVLNSQLHQDRRGTLGLSNAEMLQCEEYLGVYPADLGMRLEEFNEMLLEQVLVSSALENDRQNNSNTAGPTSEQGYVADVDGDAVGSQRPDTPHPDTGIVQADELAQRVARWVNDGVDGNWELIGLGSQDDSTRRSRDMVLDGANSTVGLDTGATHPDCDPETPVEMMFSGEDSMVLCPRPEIYRASGAASVRRETTAETERVGEEVENGSEGSNSNVIRRQLSCPDFSGEDGVQGTQETSVAGPSAPCSHVAEISSIFRSASLPTESTNREFSSVWKALIARLALSGDVDPKLKFPHIGMVLLAPDGKAVASNDCTPGQDQDDQVNKTSPVEDTPRFVIQERVRTDHERSDLEYETAAVSNPDGSLMLIKVPKVAPEVASGSASGDLHIVNAISKSDVSVQAAITQGDVGNDGDQVDTAIVQAVARTDEDFVERLRRSDLMLRENING